MANKPDSVRGVSAVPVIHLSDQPGDLVPLGASGRAARSLPI